MTTLQRFINRMVHRKRPHLKKLYCPRCGVPMGKHQQKKRYRHSMEEGRKCPSCGLTYNDMGA